MYVSLSVCVCAGVCEGQKDHLVPLVQGPSDTTDLHTSRWLSGSRKPESLLSPDLLQICLQLPQQEHAHNPGETSPITSHTNACSNTGRTTICKPPVSSWRSSSVRCLGREARILWRSSSSHAPRRNEDSLSHHSLRLS